MNEIQIFNNPQFGDVRTAGTPDNPLFCLADVCKVLDLQPSRVKDRLDDGVTCSKGIIDSLGREQQANFITEDGLYDVILDSRKPEAKAFRKWITSEVIPSIRKHGAYMTEDTLKKALTSPDFLIQLATELKAEQEANRQLKAANAEQTKQIEEMKPHADFAIAFCATENKISVATAAKKLTEAGFTIGEKTLFKLLRDDEIFCKKGQYYNQPQQDYVKMGLFILEPNVYSAGNKVMHGFTTRVTPKGMQYLIKRYAPKQQSLF